jgi:hypothetical protein
MASETLKNKTLASFLLKKLSQFIKTIREKEI